jgi:hypothetical protein
MFWSRYHGLKLSLAQSLRRKVYKNGRDVNLLIKQVGRKMYFLKQTTDIFIQMFGWILALMIFHSSLEILKLVPILVLFIKTSINDAGLQTIVAASASMIFINFVSEFFYVLLFP